MKRFDEMMRWMSENNEAVFISTSEEMTVEFGRFIGEHAESGLFIALIGDLGTGKPILSRDSPRDWESMMW